MLIPSLQNAQYGLGVSLAVSGYWLYHIYLHRHENHRENTVQVLPSLGWGNRLTLVRGLCIALMAGFIVSPKPQGLLEWLPALLYAGASIGDYFDGYIARKTDYVTQLGKRLDIEYDSFGMLCVITLGIIYGALPIWYLFVALARYIFLVAMWLRKKMGKANHRMHESIHRRLLAGLQMGFLTVVLLPILPKKAIVQCSYLFGGSIILSFLRDWLVVQGVIQPKDIHYQYFRQLIYRSIACYVPCILRPFITVILILYVYKPSSLSTWTAGADMGFLDIYPYMQGFSLLCCGLLLLGVVGRSCAIVLIGAVFLNIHILGLNDVHVALLLACSFICLFGSGIGSLWKGEDRFILTRSAT